jgi:hypothetical protein
MADDAERRELSLRAMFTPVLIRLKLTHGVTRAGGHEFFKSPCRKRESGPTRGRPGLATAWGPYFDAMFLGVDAQIVIDVGGQTVRYDLTAGRGLGTCNRPRGSHRSPCSFAPSPSVRAATWPRTYGRSQRSRIPVRSWTNHTSDAP